MTTGPETVTVLGIGADGWAGLAAPARFPILRAEVVIGSERHLALLPTVEGQERRPLPRPLLPDLETLIAETYAGRRLVVLASGDPLLSGIAGTLVDRLGDLLGARLKVVPHVSSVALARARMRWPAESCCVVRLAHRHRVDELRRELAPGRRVLVLSADADTPGEVATLLVEEGHAATTMTVLGDLGGEQESSLTGRAGEDGWLGDVPALHVLALELDGPVVGSWATGLPDEAFEHDGQLTKRDLRVSALARLAPQPGQTLWDVGAGAGSVGIEWMRAHPSCRAVAVEADPERARRIARNADRLGVPDLVTVEGTAPDALAAAAQHGAPHAVFVGGGATAPGLLDHCRDRLRPGGRLVVHGVTLETEALLAAAYARHGGELTRHAVEHAAPIGTFTGWTPARTVTQWAWTKATS